MTTFMIGGQKYEASITYRVKQIFSDAYGDQEKIKNFKQQDHENVYLSALFKSLKDQPFPSVDAMLDVMEWSEYDAAEKFFRDLIKQSAGTRDVDIAEIEKK